MIKIEVKAITDNAFNGLKEHFKECNKFRNKVTLKAHGVKQALNKQKRILTINYANLLNKLVKRTRKDLRIILKEEQKQDFIKHVENFMSKQNVKFEEYEVIFENDTE